MANLSLDDIILRKRTIADVSLSLDEFIENRNIPSFKKQNVKRLGKNKPIQEMFTAKNVVTDARNKIIQKKRSQVGDLRERIGQSAKQGDARKRLNKLKKGNLGTASTRVGGEGVAQRLSTKKVERPVNRSQRDSCQQPRSQMQVRNQNVRMQQDSYQQPMSQKQVSSQNVSMQQDSYQQPMSQMQVRSQNVRMQQDSYQQPMNKMQMWNQNDIMQHDSYQQPRSQMQIRNQNVRMQYDSYQQQSMRLKSPDMVLETGYPQEQVYYQDQPIAAEEYYQIPHTPREIVYVDERGVPITERPVYDYVDAPMSRPAPVLVQKSYSMSPAYADPPMSRPTQVRVKRVQTMPSRMAARMDQHQPQPQQQRTQQQQRHQQGYKVLVNNLDSSVSAEDVEELFSTIGSIISIRMIMQGLGEVIFKKEEDASKSVRVFNDRKLDGLIMKVKKL